MKKKTIISWVLRIIVAVILGLMGVNKVVGHADSIELFTKLNMEPGGRMITGVFEILAAVLLLITPSVSWGAILAWGLMMGALFAHVSQIGFQGQYGVMGGLAFLILVISTSLIFLHRSSNPILNRILPSKS